jgi:hypothetical protein
VIGKLLLRNKKSERGQSLAEFALILPIFLILVFAIVDFGMGFHYWITSTNAAREGARVGAVGASAPEIDDKVRSFFGDQEKVAVDIEGAQGAPGDSVRVEVKYDYEIMTPLAGLLKMLSGNTIGPTLTLSSSAEMRLE